MAKEEDTILESSDRELNEEHDTDANGTIDTQFDQQFNQKYDWRFLKNVESVVHQQLLTVEDVDNVGASNYRLVGDGVFYNAHFRFSIIEMGVSWNAVPGVNVLYRILKVPPGTDVTAGTPITWRFIPKDFGTASAIPDGSIVTIPSFTGVGVPDEDDVNMYIPVLDSDEYSFDRCDRLAIELLNPSVDIINIVPITFTFRIRHQKL